MVVEEYESRVELMVRARRFMKEVNEFKWQFNRLFSRCKQINKYTIAKLLKLNLKLKEKCCDGGQMEDRANRSKGVLLISTLELD